MAAIFHCKLGHLISTGLALVLWLAVILFPGNSYGHDMPRSLVELTLHNNRITASLTLPADRLERAFIQAGLVADPGPGTDSRPQLQAAAVEDYVLRRFQMSATATGERWPLRVTAITAADAGHDDWLLELEILPFGSITPDSLWLRDEVITREIATHSAIISIQQDWQSGILPDRPRLLGQLRGNRNTLSWQRDDHSQQAVLSMVRLGFTHILHGPDHLAFLLTLILTVPVTAVAGRWYPQQPLSDTLMPMFIWITAFSLGHSCSLILTAFDLIPVNITVVEVLVALSVAISALHAIRPLYPGYEAWIAAGFGLVHGMAFAEVLRDMSLSPLQLLIATASFNVGIELAQLALVVCTVPLLLGFRHHRSGNWLRQGISSASLLAAGGWIIVRLN